MILSLDQKIRVLNIINQDIFTRISAKESKLYLQLYDDVVELFGNSTVSLAEVINLFTNKYPDFYEEGDWTELFSEAGDSYMHKIGQMSNTEKDDIPNRNDFYISTVFISTVSRHTYDDELSRVCGV